MGNKGSRVKKLKPEDMNKPMEPRAPAEKRAEPTGLNLEGLPKKMRMTEDKDAG